jgi:PAS domain S-box-containing protein
LRVKGIVVIVIPLMPLVVIAALFLLGARNAGTSADWMGRAYRTQTQLATVLRLVVDADAAIAEFSATHSPDALGPAEAADGALPAAVDRLRSLVWDNPDQVRHARAVAAILTPRPFAAVVDAAHRRRDLPASDPLVADSRASAAALRRELAAMQELQDRLLAARADFVRRLLVWLAVGGAVFGVIFGMLGMTAFVSGVVSRIDRLRADAGHLAHGEPLGPLHDASDELGELTRCIHEAAATLRAREAQVRAHVAELATVNGDLDLAREELDQFFSLSLDLLGIVGADGCFRRVNPAWERVLGWTPEKLTATPYLDFVHRDDRAATIAEGERMASGEVMMGFENRYQAKDGSYRWLNWSAVASPATGLVYAAARDVTAQKRAAIDLERHAAELSAVNEELEAFSYSVSHDLRAPLRHVTGFATLLERSAGGRLAEPETRYVRTIVDAASRMGRLIDDLLAFSRMGRSPIERRRISLADVVRDARHDLPSVEHASEIAWTVHPMPEVEADPALLRQVFVNLLSNAAKYSGARPHPAVEIGVAPSGAAETVVYVRDNGVGFDMAYVDKLFGVFQRLHSSDAFEGTGIGLANVRRIVHRHGGRVWAEGAVDAGATFYFSLPQTTEP